jgi:DNA-binding CsgD family transcriptional regulator
MARLNLHLLDSELDALVDRGLPGHRFRHEAMARVRHVVPVDAYCFSSADPHSLVMTSTASEGVDREQAPALYRNESDEADFSKHVDLARGRRPVRILAEETDGDPGRSTRYREILSPMGLGHELRAAAIDDGVTWGFVHLFRAHERPAFDADEAAAVQAISRHLARGLRGVALAPTVTVPRDEAPSMILVDAADRAVVASGAAGDLLRGLGDPEAPQELPDVVIALAAQARGMATRDGAEAATARMQGPDGRWWLLHASATTGDVAQVAIIVQPASGPDVAFLILRGLRLSAAEIAVVQLVLAGRSTKEIADDLIISPWTVQDRLKRVFEKVGVRSRRELVARVHGPNAG